MSLLAAGCADQTVRRAEAIRDRACACTTAACAEEEVAAFATVDRGAVPARHRGQLERIARDLVGCLERLYRADAP
ncbi:MAG: hypothetical protein R2939_12170 [Kofleriaceae bacterium]